MEAKATKPHNKRKINFLSDIFAYPFYWTFHHYDNCQTFWYLARLGFQKIQNF